MKEEDCARCPHCGGRIKILCSLGDFMFLCQKCHSVTVFTRVTNMDDALKKWNKRCPKNK